METQTADIHLNVPQLIVGIVQARETYVVAARGTGKSEGKLAPAAHRNMITMPRCLGANVGATFAQILTRTLPSVIKGWEKLGYKRDVHYTIGHYGPKAWNWPKPYWAPIDAKHLIHWYTGAAIQMVSQDGVGMANGMSVDFIHGDEARFLKYDKFHEELLPINRGNNVYFGHLPQHHSIMLCTDMPKSTTAQWILEKQKLCDEKIINLIINVQYEINQLRELLPSYAKSTQVQVMKKIKQYEKQLALLRMNAVHYIEANTIDNIHALGLRYIADQKRNLSPEQFDRSILNKRTRDMKTAFYVALDEETHTYESYNQSHFENVGYDFERLQVNDSRKDGLVNTNAALDIAIDYGASINFMVVGQKQSARYYNIVKEHWRLSPELLEEVVRDFVNYYKYHNRKVVNYYYDHTAIGKDGKSRESYRDIVMRVLRDSGWQVNMKYTGQAPNHEDKYNFFIKLMSENTQDLPCMRIDRGNCPALWKSMSDAKHRQTDEGFKKDKRSERDPQVPQQFATHGSDSFDQLIWGKLKIEPSQAGAGDVGAIS
jgi:hypothetical protein